MGLLILIVGLVLFIAPHVIVTQRETRANLIARLGEASYKLGFSLVSILGVVLIAWGFARYRASGWLDVWYPPAWTRHLADALILPAFICLVAAYAAGNIKRVLKHPMLVGVKLWAFAHLLANGDLGSIILFGSILGWAVYDRISLKRRSDPGGPPIPVGGWKKDFIAVTLGIVLYLALGLVFHPLVIGVPAFG
jgi:uncharacterized membrane protein